MPAIVPWWRSTPLIWERPAWSRMPRSTSMVKSSVSGSGPERGDAGYVGGRPDDVHREALPGAGLGDVEAGLVVEDDPHRQRRLVARLGRDASAPRRASGSSRRGRGAGQVQPGGVDVEELAVPGDVLDQRPLERRERRVEGLQRAERGDVDLDDGALVEPALAGRGPGLPPRAARAPAQCISAGQLVETSRGGSGFRYRPSVFRSTMDACQPPARSRRRGRSSSTPAVATARSGSAGTTSPAWSCCPCGATTCAPARSGWRRRGARPDRAAAQRPRPGVRRRARPAPYQRRRVRLTALTRRASRRVAASAGFSSHRRSRRHAAGPAKSKATPRVPDTVRSWTRSGTRTRPAPASDRPSWPGATSSSRAFDVVLERVAHGRPERSLVLTGLRGVGKTVLLNALRSSAVRRQLGHRQARGPPRPARCAARCRARCTRPSASSATRRPTTSTTCSA